jgi:magnesium-protoporphyrin O-methyltransferase
MFKARFARRNLKQYRKKGLGAIERRMVASIAAADLNGARVLEIGGGIGTIQAELLASGAREGEVVELVSAYEPYARQLAQEKGLETRSRFRVADVLEQPDAAAPATIVVLNRVVCCSPDGLVLTELAARLAERMLILSFPRGERFFVRLFANVVNGLQRLLGRSFRVFLHPRASLYAAAQTQGFVPTGSGHNIVWEFVALRRT